MKYILILLLLLLLLPMAMANTEKLGVFKLNSCIELKQSCSNCTSVNITSVNYPNSSKAITNKIMTKSGTEYNYSCGTSSVIGEYIVNGIADVDGLITVWSYNYEVTNSGSDLTIQEGILYVVALVLIFCIFLLSLYFSIVIPFGNGRNIEGKIVSINDLKYLKIFLIACTYMLFLFLVGITNSITTNFLYLSGIGNIFNWMFQILLRLLYPIIIVTGIFSFIIFVDDLMMKRMIKRGGFVR